MTDKDERVGFAACGDYGRETLDRALTRLLDQIDGLSEIKAGMRVAIKVNLVAAKQPEAAATTPPALVYALCRILKEKGAHPVIGDSPGGSYTEKYVRSVYRSCGFDEDAVREAGGVLNGDFSISHGTSREAVSLKSFSYSGWLDRADCIINVCKLKSHGMMQMTCAVKNIFGAIPGVMKPECHMRFPNLPAFANVMVDLQEYFKPVLHIVDAVDCMEGNGPTAGTPRHIGVLMASRSPYAADMAAAHLIGLERNQVATLDEAWKRGLGPESFADVACAGDDPERFYTPDFKGASEKMSITFASGNSRSGRLVSAVMKKVFATRPQVHAKECVGCRRCEQVCPANAIHMERNIPVIDRNACIHCFCCQEFCPKGAMRVHRSAAGRILRRVLHPDGIQNWK